MKKFFIFNLLQLILFSIFVCFTNCIQQISGGSGSTTTNGFTAMVQNGIGAPISNAIVHIRPNDYCSPSGKVYDTAGKGSVRDTFTGRDGFVGISDLIPGSYTIEVMDTLSEQGVVVRCSIPSGESKTIGILTTQPIGAVRGTLDAEFLKKSSRNAVQVYGMERLAPVDSETGGYYIDDLPPANYAFRVVSMDSSVNHKDLDSVTIISHYTVIVGPFSEWLHNGILTINTQAAGLKPSDTVINFPLLLRLDKSNFDFSTAKKNGVDLRVTKKNGSSVHFETEWWDSANSYAAIWILIDTLMGSKPQQTLNFYWGNLKASSVSKATEVFDTNIGYQDVWHLSESGGTEQKDATVNSVNGSPSEMDGANDIPGLIGRSQEFNKESQHIEFNLADNKSNVDFNDTSFTISLWVKPSSGNDTGIQGVISLQNKNFGLLLDNGKRWVVYGESSGGQKDSCFSPAVYNTWSMIGIKRNGSLCYLYINDSLVSSFSNVISVPNENVLATVLRLGCLPQSTGWFSGVLDEFRIYKRQMSDLWITLCYRTQRENQNVLSFKKQR
jgi:hypothetical protein